MAAATDAWEAEQHNTEGQPTVVLAGDTVHVFGWVRVVDLADLDPAHDRELIAAITGEEDDQALAERIRDEANELDYTSADVIHGGYPALEDLFEQLTPGAIEIIESWAPAEPCEYTNCHAPATRTVNTKALCNEHADEFEAFLNTGGKT